MRDLADIFKSLGEETRLMMIALLFKKPELCVCDFEGALMISQSKASRHLQTLKHAGFLSDRREGLWVYYRISKDLDSEHAATVKLLRKMLGGEKIKSLHDQMDRWFERKKSIDSQNCDSRRKAKSPDDPSHLCNG